MNAALSPLLAFLRFPAWELDASLVAQGLFRTLIILVLAYLARRFLKRLAARIARSERDDPSAHGPRAQRAATLAQLLIHAGSIVIVLVAGLLFLDIFLNIGPLLAGAGVMGVAVSLGGQGVMRDIITGFFIVLEDQYGVGDRVRIGGVEGTVHQLTLRTTVLRAADGTLHYLANGSITVATNLSRRPGGSGAA